MADGQGLSVDDILRRLPSYAGSATAAPDLGPDTLGMRSDTPDGPAPKPAGPTRRSRLAPQPPPGFILHEVAATETEAAVAIKYGMTAGDLRRVNHLSAGYVFPGQFLCVRDPQASSDGPQTSVMDAAAAVAKSTRPLLPTSAAEEKEASDEHSKSAAAEPRMQRLRSYAEQSTTMAAAVSDVDGLDEGEFVNASLLRLRCMYVTDGLGMIPGVIECNSDYVRFQPALVPVAEELGEQQFSFTLQMADLLPPRTQDAAPDFSKPRTLGSPGAHHTPQAADGASGTGADMFEVVARDTSSAAAERLEKGELAEKYQCGEDSTNRQVPATADPAAAASAAAAHVEAATGRAATGNDSPASHLQPATPAYPVYIELLVRLVFGPKPTVTTTQAFWLALSPGRIQVLYDYVAAQQAEAEPERQWLFVDAASSQTLEDLQQASLGHVQPDPELLDDSNLLTAELAKLLSPSLPTWLHTAGWCRLYSTWTDGKSLKTLYRQLGQHDGPTLLVLRDSAQHVFGYFAAKSWHVSETFYGTGESFLFTLVPQPVVYPWAGVNSYFQMGKTDSIMVGGGRGEFALWIHESLTRGTSHPTPTYDNECLASSVDFRISGLEVWGFDSSVF